MSNAEQAAQAAHRDPPYQNTGQGRGRPMGKGRGGSKKRYDERQQYDRPQNDYEMGMRDMYQTPPPSYYNGSEPQRPQRNPSYEAPFKRAGGCGKKIKSDMSNLPHVIHILLSSLNSLVNMYQNKNKNKLFISLPGTRTIG